MADDRDRDKRRKRRGDTKNLDESILEKYSRIGVSLISDDSPKALDPTLRAEMESLTGADLADVRIHTGDEAGGMADAMGARAFAVGSGDVFFAKGEYRPDTAAGKALLAHELTHVAEGGTGRAAVPRHAERQEMEVRAKGAQELILAREQAPEAPKETEMIEPVEVEPPARGEPGASDTPAPAMIDKAVLEDRIVDVIERESRRERDRKGQR